MARQYSGTAGRIEDCRVGVFLGSPTPKGRALIDRGLYLPRGWAEGGDRRGQAGVPDGVGFATEIVLARRMIDRAVAAGVRARWVTADAVYGSDHHLRATAVGHGLGYVAAVRADFAVWAGFRQVRAKALLAEVPEDGWTRPSGGAGAEGPRGYDWGLLRTPCPEPEAYARWVLIRRSTSDPDDVTYFARGGPPAATLGELARVAGTRWAIEDHLARAEGDCGVDEYGARSWVGWHRRVTLSLFALAVVAVSRSRAVDPGRRGRGRRGSS